jgi:hypothetical protein
MEPENVKAELKEELTRTYSPEDYTIPGWLTTWFDARQQRQIEFALTYANDFHHGADGHNSMMIIARLVEAIKATSDTRKPLDVIEAVNKG